MYFFIKKKQKTKGTVKDARRSRNNNFQKELKDYSEYVKFIFVQITDRYFRCSTLLDLDGMFYSGLGMSAQVSRFLLLLSV